MLIIDSIRTYFLKPRSQNNEPHIRARTVVKKNLTAVYCGFRQYDLCCFHKQAKHWTRKDCEYCVGKYMSLESGAGLLSSSISALFLLQVKSISCQQMPQKKINDSIKPDRSISESNNLFTCINLNFCRRPQNLLPVLLLVPRL